MPQIKGFGRREGEGKESGSSTIIIDFPDAMKHVPYIDASGGIATKTVPNPHQRAMGLDDVRKMQKSCGPGSPVLAFFREAEKQLLHHIETTAATLHPTEKEKGLGLGLNVNLGTS